MAKFTKESIQRLRDTIDIVDVVTRSVPLKKVGSSMRGLCPFHSEKTASFHVRRTARRYHCFGCGAHGDAVSFLMQHEGMSFMQSILFLAERFQVRLEEDTTGRGNDLHEEKKARCKAVLEEATRFFHIMLLYGEEAGIARKYLSERGISIDFVRDFSIGYCPLAPSMQGHLIQCGFSEETLVEAGLVHRSKRDFFSERITFPVVDTMGSPIAFSARKIKETTYGGKYINTPETALFKKSHTLFGLFYSKKRIVKDRTALLVEGQLDALQLIYNGFDYAVATLGTAFCKAHVDNLKALGVEAVYIAFDSDDAGRASSMKAGELLIRNGFSVFHISLDGAKDPDEFLCKRGRSSFLKALFHSVEHIDFCLGEAKKNVDWSSASEREKALRKLVFQVREWNNPLLIHEAIQYIANVTKIPLELLQEKRGGEEKGFSPSYAVQNVEKEIGTGSIKIDSDTELELDLLRWLLMLDETMKAQGMQLISEDDFTTTIGQKIYTVFADKSEVSSLIDLAGEIDCSDVEEAYIQYMVQRPPLPSEKALRYIQEAAQKLKNRNWFRKREEIREKMVTGGSSLSEQDQMKLLEAFSSLKPPTVHRP